MMGGYGISGGYGFGGMMLLWWVLIIVAIVMMVKWLNNTSGESGSNKALEILKERFARGEIDEQEFKKRKHELNQ
jgi:putative membrane protein